MANQYWSGDESRKIIQRIVVEGDLILQTPAHFGNGDGDDLTDMPLLIDPCDDRTPLLTGASIAGALRSYLRSREYGERHPHPGKKSDIQKENDESLASRLFGGLRGYDMGEQSPLIVDECLGVPGTFAIEMRDGVRIKPDSRTAEQDKLFNLQLWEAGTTFPLRFELLIRKGEEPALKQALAAASEGFSDGGITLGARKRRGYGEAKVAEWRVTTFDLNDRDDLLAWVALGLELPPIAPKKTAKGADLGSLLGVQPLGDARRTFTIKATFAVDGSLLIRSGTGKDDTGPDMVHLHSVRPNGPRDPHGKSIPQPIFSGTSLGGALRARALKIVNTLDPSGNRRCMIDGLFGAEMKKDVKPQAGRINVRESIIAGARADLVQNRVSIDRFTGGARDTALFNEQPAFGGELELNLSIVNPEPHEIGILLLLLKDLWTCDLPLGGEASVGRGRLKGINATLTHRDGAMPRTWDIKADGEGLAIPEGRDTLEKYVSTHLKEYLDKEPVEVKA
jgi:CRISPR/Cas system CSM-associated protein Csm3 (group 7 of RAMP superfamily)